MSIKLNLQKGTALLVEQALKDQIIKHKEDIRILEDAVQEIEQELLDIRLALNGHAQPEPETSALKKSKRALFEAIEQASTPKAQQSAPAVQKKYSPKWSMADKVRYVLEITKRALICTDVVDEIVKLEPALGGKDRKRTMKTISAALASGVTNGKYKSPENINGGYRRYELA